MIEDLSYIKIKWVIGLTVKRQHYFNEIQQKMLKDDINIFYNILVIILSITFS